MSLLVHHFPRPCPPTGWPNLVIHARGRGVEYAEHEAPLSIKCVLQGQEVHEVRGVSYTVDERSYLLLNHGQRYSSRIDRSHEAETFTVFFERRFAEQTLRALAEPQTRLVDRPDASALEPVRFVESLYPHDPPLRRELERIRRRADQPNLETPWLEERLYAILARLLALHTDLLRQVDRLPALRESTRLEQYRRLRVARDFIDANSTRSLPLAEVAQVACLSPYHLLRLFKAAFGETPHQRATRRRLQHARELLESTDLPVSRICAGVGYESVGSFSGRFRKHFGLSPRQTRTGHGEPSARKARFEKSPLASDRSVDQGQAGHEE